MGHCRFGDKCAYLHVPPTPPSQTTASFTSPSSALSPLQSFSPERLALTHLPSTTEGSPDRSRHNSVEDLTTMMQQYSFGPTSSKPGSGLMSLSPVPPCTPATYDPFSSPYSTPGVRLVPVPVPVPVLPAMFRRGSESLVHPSPNSKWESPLRNRSRSITYGVNLFKSKHRIIFCSLTTLLTRR